MKSIINLLALIVFLPIFILAAVETTRLFSRASGTTANIQVDTKIESTTVRRDMWLNFAQGGEEAKDMIAPILQEVQNLNPVYIRLDHIYDYYDVVQRSGDGLTFHFEKLDEAVDSIIATGALPFLSLSYMPAAIARDGVIINEPNDWNEWALVVQKTIERYSGRSQKNIRNIHYEVWNEPDLAQFGSWKTYGEKNYMTLYDYASRGALAAQNVNIFLLGGPSTTGLYENWIKALAGSGYRVDFLSWHTYSHDPFQFSIDQRNIYTWLLEYPKIIQKPKIITEFGPSGAKDSRYGTNYASAHAAAVFRQLLHNGLTYIFSFELKDGPQDSDGSGWGILTHESVGVRKKPRYNLYPFLEKMEGTRLQLTGEGSWVTGFAVRSGRYIRVLLINFDQSGNHSEAVPLTLSNLDPGTYTFTVSFLNQENIQTSEESISGTSLSKQILMSPQSVAIIELLEL